MMRDRAFTLEGPDRLLDRRGTLGRTSAAAALAERIEAGERLLLAELPEAGGLSDDRARARQLVENGISAVIVPEFAGNPEEAEADAALAPTHQAAMLVEAGIPVISALSCRDRNRVALEGELAALADVGVDGVLVTMGEDGAGSAPVFDLDVVQLVALAARAGHFVVVTDSPTAEVPRAESIAQCADRLEQRVAAGADLVVVGPCSPEVFDRVVAALVERDIRVPLIPAPPLRPPIVRPAVRPIVRVDAHLTSRPRHHACPKTMSYGPCGGVNRDGTCEIAPVPCAFLGETLPVVWPGDSVEVSARPVATAPTFAAQEILSIMAKRPLVMTGFPVRPMIADDVQRTADALRGSTDAVLSGDAGRSRTQFPPAYRALLMARAGMRVWMGTNTRDRNRTAIEAELASMREIGVAGVHCVTGDHTETGDRPDARPVFDLESTPLIALAASLGLLTSFAESPDAPPIDARGARVREKQRAGGRMCLTQYCGDAEDVEAFIARCRAAGSNVPVLPGVPLVVDREGAELLASFHAATLPTGYVERLLAARDVRTEGIRLAISYGASLLGVPGVGGVVVAGGSRPGDELDYARALAEVAADLGGGS